MKKSKISRLSSHSRHLRESALKISLLYINSSLHYIRALCSALMDLPPWSRGWGGGVRVLRATGRQNIRNKLSGKLNWQYPTASEGQSSYIAAQPGTSFLEGQLTPSRMGVIRRSLAVRGLSDDAITIISASWSSETDKQYKSAWKKWCGWCDLLQASVDEVVNFLSQSFAEGKSYSTVNTYQSALSSTLYPVNNVAVGSHPLVVRLLKGIYTGRKIGFK